MELPPLNEPPTVDPSNALAAPELKGGAEPPQRLTLVPPERQQQAARWIVRAMRNVRAAANRLGGVARAFLPKLLPTQEPNPWALGSPAMMFIAVLVPLVVVTIASAVYFRYGRSVQYEQYLVQVRDARAPGADTCRCGGAARGLAA